MGPAAMKIKYFKSAHDFRRWLEKNHATMQDCWVGYYKKSSRQPSMTWPESVDEALCYGWIDGIRKSVNESSYKIRFTPRKATSTWSLVNLRRVIELTRAGRMQPAGLKAHEERAEAKSGIYSYEQRQHAALDAEMEKEFRRNRKAWMFF